MRKLFTALAPLACVLMARPALPADEEPGPDVDLVRPTPVAAGAGEKDAAALRKEIDRWVRTKYIAALRAARARKWKQSRDLCAEILQIEPEDLRAARLKSLADKNILAHQRKVIEQETSFRDEQILDELEKESAFPDDKPPVPRPKLPLRGEEKKSPAMQKMEEALNQQISMNLIDVDLEYVLHLLFNISGVNIIADQSILEGKRLTLQVNDMPLRELLKFIAKNHSDLGYTIGESAVWINSADAPMLEPRHYPLTRGLVSKLQFQGASRGGGGRGGTAVGGRNLPMSIGNVQPPGGQQQGSQGADQSYLEDVISWMEGWTDDWPQGSQWMVDRKTNTLLVLTTPEMHAKMAKMLDIMDTPPIQVLIKTRFIEVTVDDQYDFGIDFPQVETRHGDVAVDVGSGTDLGVTAGEGANIVFTGRHTDPRFQMVMRALEKNERSKLLSAPQILALNNQIATIDVSKEFQYATELVPIQDTIIDDSSSATAVTSYVQDGWVTERVGFLLEVMPSVGRDMKTIILDLHPVVDEVEGGTDRFMAFDIITEAGASSGTQQIPKPVIDRREIKTKLVINDGDYVIIGGLMRNTTTKTVRRVPILGYIPLLGLLFRSTSDTVVKSNLIIVVQARIVTPSGQSYTDSVADQFREASGIGRPPTGETVPLEIGEMPKIPSPSARGRSWHTEYTSEIAELYEKSRKKEGSER